MVHKEKLIIPRDRFDYINKTLREKILSEDEVITETVHFDDDFEIDLKVVGCSDEPAYTEAVLFKPIRLYEGESECRYAEVGCSEVEDTYDGVWAINFNDDVYVLTVDAE